MKLELLTFGQECMPSQIESCLSWLQMMNSIYCLEIWFYSNAKSNHICEV